MVTVVGVGVPTPTAIAFLGGQTFVSGFGDEEKPSVHGGVYVLKGGKAVKVAGSPAHVFGLATAGTGPNDFSFNGIVARGPKLYSGVSLGNGKKDDFQQGSGPFANPVVTVDIASGAIKAISKGYRQPWQLVFIPGHSGPIVSDIGQENLGKTRPPEFRKSQARVPRSSRCRSPASTS
jgi:hypothetical protein